MPLETLISNFEAKLKSDYQPMLRAFEHDSDDDETEQIEFSDFVTMMTMHRMFTLGRQ